MNTESASPAEPRRILVWDAPVRVFHWLMVLCFAGAYLTAESEQWRLLHVTLGYTMAGLVVFRVLWGLVGTRHARFASFVRGPAAVKRYLASLVSGRPEHHTGHNPAGALAILALLALAVVVTATGWATFSEVGGKWLEELHEGAANVMLALVGIHVAAVIVSSWLERQNLVAAMISGRKPGTPDQGGRRAWRSVAAIMLSAVLGFWWLQWQDAPAFAQTSAHSVRAEQHQGDD
jgi:cytochrome b